MAGTVWIEGTRRPGSTVRILFGGMVWNQPDFAQVYTEYTEGSGTAATWGEMVSAPSGFSGYALFGMPIPIENGIAVADATASWTESSVSASTWVEAGT